MSNSTADKFVGKQITPPETIDPVSFASYRDGCAEWFRRALEAEAELRQARVIIRRLANVIEMGGESGGPLAEADEWLLKE